MARRRKMRRRGGGGKSRAVNAIASAVARKLRGKSKYRRRSSSRFYIAGQRF